MRILITGSKGTLGVPLAAELRKRGHEVFGLDLKHTDDKNNARCDVSDYRQLRRALESFYPDVVYHLAAEFGRINGEEYYEQVWRSNVIGTRNMLEIQKIMKFKLIFASSSEIYGDSDETILTEETAPAPQKNDYAISKWVNELQCRNFRERYGNQIMTLRFFNAYGPGEYYTNYRSVVCLFCYRALHDIRYTVYDGYHRVFMYINDFIPTLANACERFIDGEVVNIGGTEYRSVKELSDIILKHLGKDDSIVDYQSSDKHNVTNKRPDISKAVALLGHNPSVTLEEGVVSTLEWMKFAYAVNLYQVGEESKVE
jgi:dTDP-glucose 4,6-dehydratase